MPTSRSVVVTGVSTGIGLGITRVLLGAGYRVFGSVRKTTDAERLPGQLGPQFRPLLMDVTDEVAVRNAAAIVAADLGQEKLAGLVNNAGIVVGGPLLHIPPAEVRRQMEVNVIAPMVITQAFGPLLGADRSRTGKPGRVVNISSTGGKMAFPLIAPYAMSKHALEAFSESLRRELMLYGIDVIIIGPGAVKSEIWGKSDREDYSMYRGTDYYPFIEKVRAYFSETAKTSLEPEAIGRVVLRALTAKKPRVRYAVVPKRFQNWTLPMLLPKRAFDRSIAKALGLHPSALQLTAGAQPPAAKSKGASA